MAEVFNIGARVRVVATGQLGMVVDGGCATPLDYLLELANGALLDVAHGEVAPA